MCVYYYDTTSKKEEKSTRIGVSPRYTNKKGKGRRAEKKKKTDLDVAWILRSTGTKK